MPEAPPTAPSMDFDTPIKQPDLTGVVADEMTTLRFGYKVLPAGSGCLHIAMEDIPADMLAWLLGEAKQSLIDKGEIAPETRE